MRHKETQGVIILMMMMIVEGRRWTAATVGVMIQGETMN